MKRGHKAKLPLETPCNASFREVRIRESVHLGICAMCRVDINTAGVNSLIVSSRFKPDRFSRKKKYSPDSFDSFVVFCFVHGSPRNELFLLAPSSSSARPHHHASSSRSISSYITIIALAISSASPEVHPWTHTLVSW